jgi:8-oxo-dGTP diphosphatase
LKISKFNIRVYGIVLHNALLLLTDEFRLGRRMTKFPGGGLKFGEGTIDCLKREFREELNIEIQSICHFYTTDYFQPTFLLEVPQQLISIYYLVKIAEPEKIPTTDKKFDFNDLDGAQSFRWADMNAIPDCELTFPTDRKALKLLRKRDGIS